MMMRSVPHSLLPVTHYTAWWLLHTVYSGGIQSIRGHTGCTAPSLVQVSQELSHLLTVTICITLAVQLHRVLKGRIFCFFRPGLAPSETTLSVFYKVYNGLGHYLLPSTQLHSIPFNGYAKIPQLIA